MQKSPTCKYLDHGNTAPREYGRYCTAVDKTNPINISESACDECSDFTPKIMSFEAWYAELYKQRRLTEVIDLNTYELLFDCWNAALAVARRRGML